MGIRASAKRIRVCLTIIIESAFSLKSVFEKKLGV